ncbi:MAG: nitroreductase family protein [Ferruginibacter sp.]
MTKTKLVNGFPFINYQPQNFDDNGAILRAKEFYQLINKRRSVREFSDRPIAREVIENIILAASTAPSGAHKQPWTFCVVTDPAIKAKIRLAAESEEKESYSGRMPGEWLKDLAPLGTGWQKPFLETAPYLIVVFKRIYEFAENGHKHNNYYVSESVGIACGLLLASIQYAGLCALTHTPSPMNFLSEILNRPGNEKPFLLIPVGYAADECYVPDLERKTLEEVSVWY